MLLNLVNLDQCIVVKSAGHKGEPGLKSSYEIHFIQTVQHIDHDIYIHGSSSGSSSLSKILSLPVFSATFSK